MNDAAGENLLPDPGLRPNGMEYLDWWISFWKGNCLSISLRPDSMYLEVALQAGPWRSRERLAHTFHER